LTTASRPDDGHFRADLEGLRGIAILLVLLCHAELPGAEAGFVGVDVFFVLSGFLITGLLVDERLATGAIRLSAFYARRIRRILPAALVVLVITLVAAQALLSPLDLPHVADDGLAATLSLANIRFAVQGSDYFSTADRSPFLHFWSLAVEEQFYLLWPLPLMVVARVGRVRWTLALVAIAVAVASFGLSLVLTNVDGPWAYYSLPTRAWELAIGGILAIARPAMDRLPGPIAAVLGWQGALLLATCFLVIGPTTAYPGVAALLPTLGAAALIASGGRAGSPGALVLSLEPLRWLGRISYSLYLWHWPVLLLGPIALGLTPGEDGVVVIEPWVTAGLILIATALAVLSWRFVEQPFRRARATRGGRIGRVALAGAAAASVACVIGVSLTIGLAGASVVAAQERGHVGGDGTAEFLDGASFQSDPSSSNAEPLTGQPRAKPSDTPAGSPRPAPSPSSTPGPTPRLEGSLPRDLTPSLSGARSDDDRLVARGCGLGLAGSKPPSCVLGDRAGSLTVALVGDSHAAHWGPALEVLARKQHWRLIPFVKYSCPFVDLPVWSPDLKREYTECATWRENVVDRLNEVKPDLVVVASNRWFPTMDDRDNEPLRQGAAQARLIQRVPGVIAILVDTPRSDVDVPACLAQHPAAIEQCVTTRAKAVTWRHRKREVEAARLTGATVVDLTKAICPGDVCPAIIGTRLVYRDHHHLTATFAASLAANLAAALPRFGPAT
jgi:peptidoglycan/LPS O-acetylase OafA/YrhL